jgi:hypothetical protein
VGIKTKLKTPEMLHRKNISGGGMINIKSGETKISSIALGDLNARIKALHKVNNSNLPVNINSQRSKQSNGN